MFNIVLPVLNEKMANLVGYLPLFLYRKNNNMHFEPELGGNGIEKDVLN